MTGMGDAFGAQLRAAKAEGELARIKDELRDFAEDNGFNPEMEPRDLLAKAAGALRSCAAMSDARYEEVQRLKAEMEAMRFRLMPEGMEWLLEVWPKWSNGEYCKFGDWWTADKYGDYEPRQLRRLVFYTPEQLREWEQDEGDNFGYEWDFMRPSDTTYRPDKSEPPAPKVLDADGVEIREGDTVYALCDGTKHVVERIEGGNIKAEGMTYLVADKITHRAPVLAADGKPLLVGEMVWHEEDGTQLRVTEFGHEEDGETIVKVERISGKTDWSECRSLSLNHEQPDSWERLREDMDKFTSCEYFGRDPSEPCGGCKALGAETCTAMRRDDVIRRAKKLAGVE